MTKFICNDCKYKFEADALPVKRHPPSSSEQKKANLKGGAIVKVKCRKCESTDITPL